MGQEKYDEAIERMSSVIQQQKDVAYAYLWRGMAYNKKKQTARMVDDFQLFLKLVSYKKNMAKQVLKADAQLQKELED